MMMTADICPTYLTLTVTLTGSRCSEGCSGHVRTAAVTCWELSETPVHYLSRVYHAANALRLAPQQHPQRHLRILCLCNGHKHRCLLVIHNSSFVSSADTRRHLRSAKHHLHVLALPAQQLRPSGVLGCWPDGVGLSPVFYPGFNEQHRLL